MIEDYAELKQTIEAAGFHTIFSLIEGSGDRMICVSHRYTSGPREGGLYGNSFWVAKRGDEWFIVTWVPTIYRIPDHERLSELCLLLLRREPTRAGDLDEETRKNFGLVLVSDEEFYGPDPS